MHYTCPGCNRAIGLILNHNGKPTTFVCPHTGRLIGPQVPVVRDTPVPTVATRDVLIQQAEKDADYE